MDEESALFRPVDLLIVAYSAAMAVLACISGMGHEQPPLMFMRYVGTVALVIIIRGFAIDHPSRLTRVISDWYPIATLPFAYSWAGSFIHVFTAHTIDFILRDIDLLLLGIDPVLLTHRINARWFTDVMQVSYCSYFALILVSCIALYQRKGRRAFSDFRFSIVLALYGTYVLFMLLPAHSPRFVTCRYLQLDGSWISAQIKAFITNTAYAGGSFPSGHAAVSLIILRYIHDHARYLMFPFMIVIILLLLATLYGGYHYFTDLIGGFMHGAFAIRATRMMNRSLQNDR